MLDSLLEIFGAESEKDKQVSELQAMDDHELADLGIARDQIEAFVEQHSPTV